MVFRVPEPKAPVRVSLVEALDYVLRSSINSDSERADIGLLLHQAHTRLMQFALTPPHLRDTIMQPLPQFTLEPVLIASAIVDGIKSGALSIEGFPSEQLNAWRDHPTGIDWSSGVVMLEREWRTLLLTPTLALVEVDALFRQPDPSTATNSEQSSVLADSETSKLRSRTGPQPTEMERLKQEMRRMGPKSLREAKLVQLMCLLKGKQTSVHAARKFVLSEFERQELRRTPNNEK